MQWVNLSLVQPPPLSAGIRYQNRWRKPPILNRERANHHHHHQALRQWKWQSQEREISKYTCTLVVLAQAPSDSTNFCWAFRDNDRTKPNHHVPAYSTIVDLRAPQHSATLLYIRLGAMPSTLDLADNHTNRKTYIHRLYTCRHAKLP